MLLREDVNVYDDLQSILVDVVASWVDFIIANAMAVVSSGNRLDKVGPGIVRNHLMWRCKLVSGSHVEIAALSSSHLPMEAHTFAFEVLHVKLGPVFAFQDGDHLCRHEFLHFLSLQSRVDI
jgi:predicted ATPase